MTPAQPEPNETIRDEFSGRRIGDYQLLRRLGRGGMADVYLAEQQSLRRKVAFKILKSKLAGDESYVRRFHHEAQAAAALVQANIIQIYEVDCVDGIHFIAQEYVAGKNLKQVLSRSGPIDVRLAVNIMRQVAAALHKAGQEGIIHRDIKPENIMLAETGEVKVADFGLARVTGNDASAALTKVGITMGTPLYMSPEQVEGRPVDPRSDLYSLGVTCYQMLAGRPPFDGDTALAIAIQQVRAEPPRLEDARPDLPGGLCRIVHKLLAKRPEDRLQSAKEVLRELRGLRVEGVEDEWPSGLDEWNSAELLALADARLEATGRLDTVMKTQAMLRQRRRALWPLLAVPVLAALLGGLVAWATRPAPLLEVAPEQLSQVPRQTTAQEQYRYAYWITDNKEQAWKAVLDFPQNSAENKLYARRAKQRLAELYLAEDRLDDALRVFGELANLDDTEVEFRAFGLAGQAIVYARRGDNAALGDKLAQAFPLRQHLDAELKATIEQLAREHQQRGGEEGL